MKGGKEEEMECDVLLVCVGRRPYTTGLGMEVRNSCLSVSQSACLSINLSPMIPRMLVSHWMTRDGYPSMRHSVPLFPSELLMITLSVKLTR